jgi:hypothetical protein
MFKQRYSQKTGQKAAGWKTGYTAETKINEAIKKLSENNFWVVGYGFDCDNQSSFSLDGYTEEDDANESCEDSNKWSDGIQYKVIGFDDMKKYCEVWDRDFNIYL